ncbi:MAG: hypothetical protein HFH87_08205 [Lachnospiraceae bacterium]|nr:hypothetical protein [Lachnospiraceae bacterium]
MNAKTKRSGLSFMSIVTEGDKSWFINESWNALFQMDRKNFIPEFVDFPKLFYGEGDNYKWLVKWKQKFIYISNRSDTPLYLIDGEGEHAVTSLPAQVIKNSNIICNILQKENILYLFSNCKDFSVLEFDMEKNGFGRWLQWDDCDLTGEGQSFQWGNVACYGGSIWSPIAGTNCIVELKCDIFKYVIHQRKEDIQYKWPFIENGGNYWSLAAYEKESNCIITGTLLSDSNDKIISLPANIRKRIIKDFRIDKNVIWLFPGDDGNIIKIDISGEICRELSYPDGFRWIRDRRYESGIRFTCIDNAGSKWILYPRTGNGILLIDKYTDVIEYMPLEVDMAEIMKLQAQNVVMENVFTLKDGLYFLLECINRKKEFVDWEVFGKKNDIGHKIFREIVN